MLVNLRYHPNAEITTESIVVADDSFDQNILETWLQNRKPKYIFSNSFVKIDIPGFQIYSIPLWLSREINHIPVTAGVDYSTDHIFNFMINKKQLTRFLCIKLVELFELNNCDYTWSGIDRNFDMVDVLNEIKQLGSNSPLSEQQKSFILGPITTPAKFFQFNDDKASGLSHVTYRDNGWTWQNGLENMFSKSAISLITESLNFQKGAMFTEKTLYAILGRTFPIWIGGYGQASEFSRMGFDVFDDVIDHSYQYCETLIERCYYAFQRNLRMLQDFEYSATLRTQNMHRLIKNQQLLIDGQITDFCLKQIEHWPEDLKSVVKPMI